MDGLSVWLAEVDAYDEELDGSVHELAAVIPSLGLRAFGSTVTRRCFARRFWNHVFT